MTPAKPVDPGGRRAADLLPGGQEPRVGGGADRLDLGAQRGQRATAQDAQHLGVAPLVAPPPASAGHELAADQPAVQRHSAQHVGGHPQAEAEPRSGLGGGERAAGPRVPAEQLAERIGDRSR